MKLMPRMAPQAVGGPTGAGVAAPGAAEAGAAVGAGGRRRALGEDGLRRGQGQRRGDESCGLHVILPTLCSADQTRQGRSAQDGLADKAKAALMPRRAGGLPAAEAMLARANVLYAELGRKLDAVVVGSSSDASLAAAAGTPVLDGFG
ncbi:MAG: hypothetical protein WDN45_00755 [Caulobacteraceae bacterium]